MIDLNPIPSQETRADTFDDDVDVFFGKLPQFAQEVAGLGSQFSKSSFQRLHMKRVAHRLPLIFPDYNAIITATGQDYIYPQAFAIDDRAKEVFILYCAATDGTSVKWVAVFNQLTNAYKSCFSVGPNRVSEGLEIRYEGTSRFLFTEDAPEVMGKYDITVLPATRSNIPATATYSVGMDRQFGHRNGAFLIEQAGTPLGFNASRTTFGWFDSAFNRVGALYLDKIESGFTNIADNPYGAFIPKRQNLALGDGVILTSHGGYLGINDASVLYAYQGIKVFNMSGERIAESIMEPKQMMAILAANGMTCGRIENEGVQVDSQGRVYSFYIHKGRFDSGVTNDGLVIFEEFSSAPDAIDFGPAVKPYRTFDQGELEDGVWPRLDGALIDPLMGTEITTMNQILDFMTAMDVKRTSFYGSSNTITDINGAVIGAGNLVTITNANNSTFFVTAQNTTAGPTYWLVTGSSGSRVQTTIAPTGFLGALRLAQSQADATQKLGRVHALHYLNAEEDFLAFDIQTTAANNSILYGGGSGVFNAATRHVFFTAPNYNTLTGTERMRLDDVDGLTIKPVASATPNNNGEMLFEATSNTKITVKLKGTDGVVRNFILNETP